MKTFIKMIVTIIVLFAIQLKPIYAGSFTDKVLHKLDSFGTMMVEDMSNIYNKSIKSVHRIASCPFGECCNSEYITANFSGLFGFNWYYGKLKLYVFIQDLGKISKMNFMVSIWLATLLWMHYRRISTVKCNQANRWWWCCKDNLALEKPT